ncbi:MAG: AmpG family muropeptide MFS transporter [Gammaproteobacteria bacterium]|nr:AmpG family muropeptide MFS transporter [Gammaproteobacteria bacterium]|tara:strand:- start:33585 stop:34838 length:1254 start_codon:yes stop_codon:yes gene_type:complete
MIYKMLKNISPYLEKKMLITLGMGFVSGVPLLLTITLLQAWLTDEGVSKSTIGLFALVGVPYSLKFLWAPIFDRYVISKLGRRRGWILITQVLLIFSIIGLGMTSPAMNAANVALLAIFVTFFSASQDIVIDAYRRESLSDNEQVLGASSYVLGYRIGMLSAGAGGLILADLMSYQFVYLIMALVMIGGVLITLIADEPVNFSEPSTFLDAVRNPFVEFFKRHGDSINNNISIPILILLFILLYKIGDTMAHSLSTNFYLEMGYTKTEIGTVVKVFGLIATLAGAFIGGLLSIKIGLYKSLVSFGIFQAIATLGFVVLAISTKSLMLLASVITLENLAAGMGYTAYLAFIANMTNKQFTATQFALMTAIMSLPRTLFSGSSGFLVEILGWEYYFIFCSLIAFPALIILRNLRKRVSI